MLWPSLALILILSLVGYGHLLAPGQIPFNPYSDFIAQHLTTKTVLYDSLRAGRGIPFWRSDQFCGYPGLTNPQTMYTYPMHFLFYLLPAVAAAGPTDWLHFLAAGAAFYALAAALGLGRWAAVFLAAAGMFNFKLLLATYAGWTPVIPIIVWHPALLAAVVYAVKRPGPAGAVAVALVGGVCLHCGQIQLLYYFAWFAVAYVLVAVVPLWRRRQRATVGRTVLWLSVGGVLAIALASYLLVPMVTSAAYSGRTEASYVFFEGGRRLTAAHLLTFLFPEALGTPLDNSYKAWELWEDVGYFGIVPLVLAVVGAVAGWRRRDAKFLAIALLVAVVVGFNTWATKAAYYVLPGFKLFRLPGRFLFLSATFGIALAGVGLEELLGRLRIRWRSALGGAVLVLAALAVVSAEGTIYARRYLTMAPQAQALPPQELRELFAADGSLYRVAPVDRYTLNAGWAAPLKVQSVGGYDGFNYAHIGRYVDLMGAGQLLPPRVRVWLEVKSIVRRDMFDALNIKYFILPLRAIFREGGFELVKGFSRLPLFMFYRGIVYHDLFVYRNDRCLGRAYWAGRVVTVATREGMALQTERNNLRECAIVLTGDAGPLASTASEGDRLDVVAWQPGRVRLATHNAAPRLAVISEVWDPGWRATIDGHPAAVYWTNIAMLGVVVPPGDHQVTVEYVPPHWVVGCGITISGAAFVVLLAGLAVARRAKRPKVAGCDQPGGDSSNRW